MAPLQRAQAEAQTQAVQHFTHPQHSLFHAYFPTDYMCDGCYAVGSGSRYHCPTCSFDLHERCATCPLTLTTHFHPHHQLTLVNRAGNGYICDLCGEQVHGMFYTCEPCGFDFHPCCTLLPLNFQHPFHPQHVLTLQPAKPGDCVVCRDACNSWRYRCSLCNVDIHIECVVAPSDASPGGCGGYATGVPASGNWTNMNMCQGGGGYAEGVNMNMYQGGGGGGYAAGVNMNMYQGGGGGGGYATAVNMNMYQGGGGGGDYATPVNMDMYQGGGGGGGGYATAVNMDMYQGGGGGGGDYATPVNMDMYQGGGGGGYATAVNMDMYQGGGGDYATPVNMDMYQGGGGYSRAVNMNMYEGANQQGPRNYQNGISRGKRVLYAVSQLVLQVAVGLVGS